MCLLKKICLVVLQAVFVAFASYSQSDTLIYELPAVPAKFPGGDSALFSFLARNIVYPQVCADSGVQGKVYVKCTVEKDGLVSSAKTIKGVHPALNEEAERVVKVLPAFSPAYQQQVPVRSVVMVPVLFKVKVVPQPVVAQPDKYLRVLSKVDEEPLFPGGEHTLSRYIDWVFNYPFLCQQLNIQGFCQIKFTIDTTGSVTNVSVLKGVHYDLDNEAIRVLKLLPDFIPAKSAGKPVTCEMVLDMNFTLACTADDLPFSSEDEYRMKYPGGFRAMLNAIYDNIYFTGDVSGFGVNGRSVVSFEVDTNGKVKNIKMVKSTFPELEKSVTNAIENLAEFKPGTIYGKKVDGKITLPIGYRAVKNADAESELRYDRDFKFVRIDAVREEYGFVDELPRLDGYSIGDMNLLVAKYFRLPEGEEKNRTKGKVYVRCFITDEGKLVNPRIYKGVSPGLEKEAVAGVQRIANITSAKAQGKPIGCEVVLPIDFSNF